MSDNVSYYIDNALEFNGEEGHNMSIKQLILHSDYIEHDKVICIDVGSNTGKEISNIRLIAPELTRKILAFEPNYMNFVPLISKFGNSSDIYCYNMAVSNTSGFMPFYNYKTQTENFQGNLLGGLRNGG